MKPLVFNKLFWVLGLVLLHAGAPLRVGAQEQELHFYGEPVDLTLTPAQKRTFVLSISQKIKDLENYITQISNKEIPLEDRLEMINSVVKLFAGENSIVQVANALTGKVDQFTVRQYFNRLATLKASRVDITFYEAVRLEKVRRGTDGYYYGTATIFQDTKIYRDPEGMHVYQDKTVKQVAFKSKREDFRVGDQRREVMETLLENIKVKETRQTL